MRIVYGNIFVVHERKPNNNHVKNNHLERSNSIIYRNLTCIVVVNVSL